MSDLSDNDIIKDVLSGNKNSFEILMERYYPLCMYFFCRRFSFSHEKALDLCQEVFWRVFKGLSGFRAGSPFKPWLFTICRNAAYSTARVRQPLTLTPEILESRESLNEGNTVVKKMIVREAIELLPEVKRQVIYMHYFWELPVQLIADKLGIPPGTVKSHLYTARKRLYELLEKPEEVV